ncbi:hypothetical protein BAUCODRAFT_36006 [Baudoinia panamericana UAMH 10762]|uniref:Zn(2)-C6 fungal-type domain-containing protein n=1 Tax=Baudoinia panamericana (strain UAMH 10762) TaxID=717646 RepID=M2MDW2_BAUPA|nr:uncharacterized protein BAUCODRAFT_36006 [Baudoinia panamericana UAMH 10762]EMC94751.1 hypothetical protein BAUCODRAFT_36006 [Baudoinia panamericana UAMH 10762]
MAEAISIPSPSVFLSRSSPTPPEAPPTKPTNTHNVPRPDTEAKKKTTVRKSSTVNNAPKAGEGDRPKQSKSRNGCVTCKAKRLKCDEEKPGCAQCKRRKVECGGYRKDFKWRPFGENPAKAIQEAEKRASPPSQASAEGSKPNTPDESIVPETSAPRKPNTKRKDSKRASTVVEENALTELPARPAKAKRKERPPSAKEAADQPVEAQPPPDSAAPHSTSPLPSPPNDVVNLLTLPSIPLQSATPLEASPREDVYNFGPNLPPQSPQAATAPTAAPSPTLTELLLPFQDELPQDGEFISFSMPEGMQFPLSPLPADVIDPALLSGGLDDDDTEELVRQDAGTDELQRPINHDRPTSSGSAISISDQLQTLWQGPVHYLYSQPYFRHDSPEMLAFRFDRLTCGILSIMDGKSENPWRTLIWPLAQRSPALYNALMAMTAYHSSNDVPALRVAGHEHKQKSIRYIQEGIRDSSMTDQTAIATALALGFSESWDQHTASGNTHIKGAQALVKRALADHQRNPLGGVELARLKFLCNAWVYMDVIARLTAVDSDESNDFDNTLLFAVDSPEMVMGDAVPGFGIDFGTGIDARLDPLMGCANTLFPLIGRVANLVRKVCRSQTNSPAVISQANDLRMALEAWEPPHFIEQPEDPTTGVQHSLQTAEAYRWATLLHLHQSVPELPCDYSSAEMAQRVLQFLATVPLASRTVIVQIYPLMVAGCEATTEEDRQWVRDRWAAMGQRMRIGVIEKCATVTEEVYRRRDRYAAQPTGRRRLVATADLQPARQRGMPLVRTDTGFQNADPGSTGMVFSYVETADGGEGDPQPGSANERFPPRPKRVDRGVSTMDAAYTVRGHLHWVGVMWDWGWEGMSDALFAADTGSHADSWDSSARLILLYGNCYGQLKHCIFRRLVERLLNTALVSRELQYFQRLSEYGVGRRFPGICCLRRGLQIDVTAYTGRQ